MLKLYWSILINAIFSDTCKVRNPCKNGATCKPDGDGATCQCPPNYQGENCDQGRHRIKVIQLPVLYQCKTQWRGWEQSPGKKLDCLSTQQEAVYALFRHFFKVVFNNLIFCFGVDVNECANNPCKNGAKCTNTRGSYTCTCDSRFTGKNCDQGKKPIRWAILARYSHYL